MKLNEKGRALWDVWCKNYYTENDKLGGNSNDGNFVDGWCIIDNTDYVKNITDECGLLIFGYDDQAADIVSGWIDEWGNEPVYPFTFTYADVLNELQKYIDD